MATVGVEPTIHSPGNRRLSGFQKFCCLAVIKAVAKKFLYTLRIDPARKIILAKESAFLSFRTLDQKFAATTADCLRSYQEPNGSCAYSCTLLEKQTTELNQV